MEESATIKLSTYDALKEKERNYNKVVQDCKETNSEIATMLIKYILNIRNLPGMSEHALHNAMTKTGYEVEYSTQEAMIKIGSGDKKIKLNDLILNQKLNLDK